MSTKYMCKVTAAICNIVVVSCHFSKDKTDFCRYSAAIKRMDFNDISRMFQTIFTDDISRVCMSSFMTQVYIFATADLV